MRQETVKVSQLSIGDRLLDAEGLELVIKNIQPAGKSLDITVGYVESEFYRAQDSTFRHKCTSQVKRIQIGAQ